MAIDDEAGRTDHLRVSSLTFEYENGIRIPFAMPIVCIEMLQGRASEVKNELIARVTDAVAISLGVDL